MQLDPRTPEQIDALGRMNKKIYDEYRNLGFAGFSVDPLRYLAFREQTKNHKFTELVVSDAGVFFFDPARRIKFKFNPQYFLVHHEGLHLVDEEKIRDAEGPIVLLDNLLEFWNRPGTGLCLVADHQNGCQYLSLEQKAELEKVLGLYSRDQFIINPMLQKKIKETQPTSPVGVFDLED